MPLLPSPWQPLPVTSGPRATPIAAPAAVGVVAAAARGRSIVPRPSWRSTIGKTRTMIAAPSDGARHIRRISCTPAPPTTLARPCRRMIERPTVPPPPRLACLTPPNLPTSASTALTCRLGRWRPRTVCPATIRLCMRCTPSTFHTPALRPMHYPKGSSKVRRGCRRRTCTLLAANALAGRGRGNHHHRCYHCSSSGSGNSSRRKAAAAAATDGGAAAAAVITIGPPPSPTRSPICRRRCGRRILRSRPGP